MPRAPAWVCFSLTFCFAVAACRFDSAVPPGVEVKCSADSDCPPGLKCQRLISLCVQAVDDTPPELLPGARVTLLPRSGGWLTAPTRLGPQARALVELRASEPVVRAAVLSSCPDLECTVDRDENPSFRFNCQLVASPAPIEQSCVLSADLIDPVSNRTTTALAQGVFADTIPPSAPDVTALDQVVLHRVPWGLRDGGPPSLRLSSEAVTPDRALVALADNLDLPLAVGEFGDGGVDIPGDDRESVRAAYVDQADNPSPLVAVRDVVLTSTFGSGTGAALNPNRAESSGASSRGRLQPNGAAQAVDPATLARDDAELAVTLGAGVWHESFFELHPPMINARSVWDSDRGRATSYGGCLCNPAKCAPDQSVWEWLGGTWARVPPEDLGDGTPPALVHHGSTYHAARRQMVVVGGTSTAGEYNADTWLWNGEGWKRLRGAVRPPPRTDPAIAYDPARRVAVMFGGRGADGGLLGDTWELDGQQWSPSAATGAPPASVDAALSWSSSLGALVMIGGQTALGAVSDAWRYDGARWQREPRLEGGPSPRSGHELTPDPRRSELWLVAGTLADGGDSRDLWAWSLDAGWQLRSQLAGFGRVHTRSVWDPVSDQLIISGGVTCVGDEFYHAAANIDTLALAPDAGAPRRVWVTSRFFGRNPPGPRVTHAMAYDPDRQRVVVHGGEYGPSKFGDTYDWDGTQWLKWPDDGGTQAGERTLHAMTYDENLGGMVLFGGFGEPGATEIRSPGTIAITEDAGTYLGTPSAGWRRLGGFNPHARALQAMYTDGETGHAVMVGGTSLIPAGGNNYTLNGSVLLGDAWERTAAGWVALPALPDQAVGAGAAYDLARRVPVVLPGFVAVIFNALTADVVFEMHDGGWSMLAPQPYPPQRTLQNVIYDSWAQRTLVYGTALGTNPFIEGYSSDRVWEWDGAQWRQTRVSLAEAPYFSSGRELSPGNRVGERWAFDRSRGRAVMFGGLLADLWEFELAVRRPRHLVTFALDAARVPPKAELRSVTVRVRAGADGFASRPDGGWVPQPGVEVRPWLESWFADPFASSGAGSASPAELEATLTAAQLEQYVPGASTLSFEVVPQGVNGSGESQLAVDSAEAEVRYRLP